MLRKITDEHREALSQVLSASETSASLIRRLRDRLGIDTAHRILSVADLQNKARLKFGPGIWWVTDRSLQQATAWQVARLKANWFGDERVHDLCCGIGGDLIWLARRGGAVGVDQDPEVAAMAEANLREAGAEQHADFQCRDALHPAFEDARAIHVDPDRRIDRPHSRRGRSNRRHSNAGRTTTANRFRPTWDELLPKLRACDAALAKLAPATRLDQSLDESHRCWISLAGSVREQTVMFGRTIERAGVLSGQRSAVVMATDGSWRRFVEEICDPSAPCAEAAGGPGPMMVDPDAAIRASGLTAEFAIQHGLKTLGGPAGFLTGENLHDLRGFAVTGKLIWHGSADDRKLRRELRRRKFRPTSIKVRGLERDPQQLLKRYKECGEIEVTLWLGRTTSGAYAAVTSPTS